MNLGAPQYWGLLLAMMLLSLIVLGLLALLRRVAADQPGPEVWTRALAWVVLGMGLAGVAALHTGTAWRIAYAFGSGLLLLGIGLLGEGLRRFQGQRMRMRGVLTVVAAAVSVILVFEAGGRSFGSLLWVSAVAALMWLNVGWVAWHSMRPGFLAIHLGLLLSALVLAAGWITRGAVLAQAGPQHWRDALPEANAWLLMLSFVASGTLALLFVLLVNFRLAEKLRAEAVRDPLTGALNRRGFEDRSSRLMALSAQLGQSVTVLVLDIDHFKNVNDQHGHQVGDRVLKALSALVHRAKRETDLFARLGGEEFCLVLPGTDVPGARVFAERLRHSFEVLEIDTGSRFLRCTMSIGVAYASAAMLQSRRVDLVDLLHQADEALYEAKRAGRNRLRFYASPEVVSSRLDSRLFATTSAPSDFGASRPAWGNSSAGR
ncbi:GGDEF domain-containing protein [Caldimonas sp.]|uniref:GGDEF domain-containing protein n=1 Tax=Caldimonas sp. TaxID=2838790 RepID=UPI00391BEE3B